MLATTMHGVEFKSSACPASAMCLLSSSASLSSLVCCAGVLVVSMMLIIVYHSKDEYAGHGINSGNINLAQQ
jgi:hypothetical protein